MRNRIGSLAWLFTVGGLLVPALARAQTNVGMDVPPPEVPNVSPLGHPGYGQGGFYTFGEFMLFTQSNPLKPQLLAFQGFTDRDGSIGAALNTALIAAGATPQFAATPGEFIGSRNPVLSTQQVSGPSDTQPGFNLGFGWRFASGLAVELGWMHFWEVRNAATASPAIPGDPGQFQENTFITSPVFNYPNNYLGPAVKVNAPGSNVGAASGIWNAATLMTIEYLQRFDIYYVNARTPLYEGETYRCYGLFGPRLVWFWDRFKWRTTSTNTAGVSTPTDSAFYTNVSSNRLWGAHFGIGNQWECGVTPVGSFACSLDIEAALYGDFVATNAKYELGDFSTAASRHTQQVTIAPELEGKVAVWWMPYEGIQIKIGYTGMVFFNTIASPRPVDFNMGAIAPPFERGIIRTVHGLDIGIAFIF
jgi:hypothetical protein